jgi:hypothetical protein
MTTTFTLAPGRTWTALASLCFAAVLAAPAPAIAGDASAAVPGTVQSSAPTSPWQQKLDSTLRQAARRSPDTVQRLIVVTASGEGRAKSESLAAWGFTVHAERGTEVVISATARDAMVLAEDPQIRAIAVAVQAEGN